MASTVPEEVSGSTMSRGDTDRPESPCPAPQKLPYDILLYTSTFLFAQNADNAIASLAGASQILNDKLMPRRYQTVYLHWLNSFKKFFQYYKPSSLAIRKSMSSGASSTTEHQYGDRHNYIGGLIEHMDVKLPGEICERSYRWIRRLRKEWKAQRKNILRPGSQIIKVSTLYIEETGEVCPCRIGKRPFITYDPLSPEGLLLRSVYPTYLGLGVRRDLDEYPGDYCKGCTDHCGVHGKGYWHHTFKTMRIQDHFTAIQTGHWVAPFEKHVYLLDGKIIAFNSCMDVYAPEFFTIPSNLDKSDRSLVILTPDPHWEDPTYAIKFLINKKAPFSNPKEWREWIKDKGEWLNTNAGTWESWAPTKQRLYTARLDEIVTAMMTNFVPHPGMLHLFTPEQLQDIIAMK